MRVSGYLDIPCRAKVFPPQTFSPGDYFNVKILLMASILGYGQGYC